ncbi:hypothetical protein AAG570_008207 [Ranatra chinensis]|uniref:Uncharacterized protein n=1 Tax=Ranatra chinensis TaxID=642074 RepID=A0ABD0XUH6_9HEMI
MVAILRNRYPPKEPRARDDRPRVPTIRNNDVRALFKSFVSRFPADNVHANAGCRYSLKMLPAWEAKRWNPHSTQRGLLRKTQDFSMTLAAEAYGWLGDRWCLAEVGGAVGVGGGRVQEGRRPQGAVGGGHRLPSSSGATSVSSTNRTATSPSSATPGPSPPPQSPPECRPNVPLMHHRVVPSLVANHRAINISPVKPELHDMGDQPHNLTPWRVVLEATVYSASSWVDKVLISGFKWD